MSIGAQFLARLSEAKDTKKTVGFDRSVEAMKRAMRDIGGENNFADKIAEVFFMCGVQGIYLNKPEIRESVVEAAQTLRSKPARVRAFLALHSALAAFHGISLSEGKEEDLEGVGFQEFVEECLVSLGIPEEMMEGGAKAGVKAGIRRTVAKLKADETVRTAFITYGRYAGIKARDGVIGEKTAKTKKVDEAIESSPAMLTSIKDPVASAKEILSALGVDLSNQQSVRVVNQSAFDRMIKASCRNSQVKRAMLAFLRVLKTQE